MEYTQIGVERRGEVSVITLQRPEKMNAWTPRMAEEQVHAIEAANAAWPAWRAAPGRGGL